MKWVACHQVNLQASLTTVSGITRTYVFIMYLSYEGEQVGGQVGWRQGGREGVGGRQEGGRGRKRGREASNKL